MYTVSFAGKLTYIDEVVFYNGVNILIIDRSFVCYKDRESDSVTECGTFEGVTKKFPKINGILDDLKKFNIKVIFTDTGIRFNETVQGITYGSNEIETVNRRIRIAKLMRYAIDVVNDDILFVDTDVTLSKDVFDKINKYIDSGMSISICIPALLKPSRIIDVFCKSTNVYIPKSLRKKLSDAIDEYLRYGYYTNYPVDIYINDMLGSYIIFPKGICHYIDDKKYCINYAMSVF